jgi:hypothetical protein
MPPDNSDGIMSAAFGRHHVGGAAQSNRMQLRQHNVPDQPVRQFGMFP